MSPVYRNQNSSNKSPLPVRVIKWTALQMFSFVLAIILLGVGYAAWTTLDRNDAASGKPVTQNLMQGIIDSMNDLDTRVKTLVTNLSTLTTRVIAINPTGTTLSGSTICIGQDCRSTWPTVSSTTSACGVIGSTKTLYCPLGAGYELGSTYIASCGSDGAWHDITSCVKAMN